MTTTFAFFNKIDGSDRFELNQMVTSPYETESSTEDTMVRDITDFIQNNSFFADLIQTEYSSLLSFGTDNSIALHPNITSVEYVNNQEYDPDNGINKIVITCGERILDILTNSETGAYFKEQFPEGYSEGGD